MHQQDGFACHGGRRAHSGFTPDCLMMLRYLALSARTKAVNCSTVSGVTSAPSSRSRALKSGCVTILLISALIRATTSFGVPRGAKMPCQRLRSKSVSPAASATVGTSGAAGERLAVDTASSFNVPALTCATAAGNPEKKKSTCPPRRSFKAGPAPLYGTWVMFVLLRSLSNSPAKWPGVPVPDEAKVSSLPVDAL